MKNHATYIIFLLAYLLVFKSYGSYEFNERCTAIYDDILHLQLQAAAQKISAERTQDPNNLIPVYLENYIDFFTLFIGEEKKEFEARLPNKESRIKLLEAGDQQSPYYRFCLADLHIQWAFSRLKFREYLTAGFEINKAYQLLSTNAELYPDFLPNRKSMGFLHVLIGTIPEQFKWVTDIIGMKGSVNLGVNELNQVLYNALRHDQYSHLRDESLFLLSFLQLHVAKDNLQKEILYHTLSTITATQHSISPLLLFCQADLALNMKKTDEAIALLERYQPLPGQFPFHHLYYLSGLAKCYRLDTNANQDFEKYIKKFKGSNYIKSAYQKMAWLAHINGDLPGYQQHMRAALNHGADLIDEDKQALAEARSKMIPNKQLLEARLCFDGGYYERALTALGNTKTLHLSNARDSLEFTYRLARVYHETGETLKAIAYYNKTIKKGARAPYYYAANAALKIGQIFEQEGDKEKAIHYYKKCFTFDNTEYRNSIRMKAKTGLSRLE